MARVRPQKPADAQKKPRVKDDKHLKFIRSLPCLVCKREGETQAAHVRFADAAYGKEEPGMGKKPDDWWVVPLCAYCHTHQHNHGERDWWYQINEIDPLPICQALWDVTGVEQTGRRIVLATGGNYVQRSERNDPQTGRED
jgi:hypothetical protein